MNTRLKLSVLAGVILLIFAVGATSYIRAVPYRHRKVEIGTARRKNLVQTVNGSGVVEPNRKQVIKLDTSQKVLEVLAAQGQNVRKGDMILRLDSSDNQYRLNVEEINLKLAEKELLKLLKNEKTDRQDVENAYRQAEIAAASAEAELLAARRALAADKMLYESGAISKIQYEESENKARDKENTSAIKKMELDRAYRSYANYDLDKEEQIFRLKSNISLIQESINNLKSKLDADTRANIDGKLVRLEIEEGQYPAEDNSEILIYDMSRYIVKLQLKQQDALYIKEGMKAKIKVRGMEEKEYKGTVLEVDEIAAARTKEGKGSGISVKISVDDPDDGIKIGYEVDVRIELSIKADAVVVDFESIIKDNDGKKYIYYVDKDIARRRTVTTGIETSFEVEITEGIIQGDKYVVNPPEDMQEKTSMKIWGWRYESK